MKDHKNTKQSGKYSMLASDAVVMRTIQALQAKNFIPILVHTKEEALAKVKELVPKGVSVMNGSSTTLGQIGYIQYLESGQHPWNDLHSKINSENDNIKRQELRKQSVLSDYYLGSVHALTEDGQLLIASNTGSQLPHIVFTSPHIIFVVSTKKIVTNLQEALQRLEEYVVPLEDERMQKTMGMSTSLNKIAIIKNDPDFLNRKIYILLVEEDLGF